MKVALIYDRINKLGGAERVLLELHQIFPEAPIFTLVHNKETASWAKNINIIPSFFNKLKFLRTRHELLMPLAAMAFETFNFDQFDVVISVTSAEAKSVITKPKTLHICYCLTPVRYLWSGVEQYRHQFLLGPLLNLYLNYGRRTDKIYSQRPDVYLSTCQEVAKRVEHYYKKSSSVIYPAINYDFFSKAPKIAKADFYLMVNRLVPYKKNDIVIDAFNQLNKPLIVVGTGSDKQRLEKLANKNIKFLGLISDQKLRKLYSQAKALIFPQVEDFGLTPLEAAATGTPTLALAAGGALETIVNLRTGLFFHSQTPAAVIDVIQRFEQGSHQITAEFCKDKSAEFGAIRFRKTFSDKVDELWTEYQKQELNK